MQHPDGLNIMADMVRQERNRFIWRGGGKGRTRTGCAPPPGAWVFMVWDHAGPPCWLCRGRASHMLPWHFTSILAPCLWCGLVSRRGKCLAGHGGRVPLKSIQGEGTIFPVTLPRSFPCPLCPTVCRSWPDQFQPPIRKRRYGRHQRSVAVLRMVSAGAACAASPPHERASPSTVCAEVWLAHGRAAHEAGHRRRRLARHCGGAHEVNRRDTIILDAVVFDV
jgi:hypothetical protein